MSKLMKFAIVQFAGKQFKVSEGDTFEVESQKAPLNVSVLLYADDKEVLVGEPTLDNVDVSLSVVEEKRGKKLRVARFKSKSRYRKVKGHRQPMSVIKVDSVAKKASKSKPNTKAKSSTKVSKSKE